MGRRHTWCWLGPRQQGLSCACRRPHHGPHAHHGRECSAPFASTSGSLKDAAAQWLPTICGLAGVSTAGKTLPLDGHDQWDVIANGAKTKRTTIFHNVPVGAAPVLIDGNRSLGYETTSCLSRVDNRTGPCHPFGVTGGAIRKGEFKLLTTYPGAHPWEDCAPTGIEQYPPGGSYPNRTRVFTPVTNDSLPEMHKVNSSLGVFLFNLTEDWTETHNLAAARPDVLADMLQTYAEYAATAVMPLTFRYGFKDPQSGNSLPRPGEPHCQGQFGGSPYCSYGHEFDCMVKGRALVGAATGGDASASNSTECHAACAEHSGCTWWSMHGAGSGAGCQFFDRRPTEFADCEAPEECAYGPADCGYGTPATIFPSPQQPPPPPPPAPCKSRSTACAVQGHGLSGGDCCGVFTVDATDLACAEKCGEYFSCRFWVRRGTQCHLKSSKGTVYAAKAASYGPRCCDDAQAMQ